MRQNGVLADLDAVGEGDLQTLLGDSPTAASHHFRWAVVGKIMTQRNGHGFLVVFAFAVFFGVRQDASFNPVSPPPGSPMGHRRDRASHNHKLD